MAVLQPSRAMLLQDGHAVGLVGGMQERRGSGGGQPAKVTGATPASQSASFKKRAGALRDLSATHPKAGDGSRVGRDISKACS